MVTINASENRNRLTEASYDGAGNVTALGQHSYSYDPLNMITRDDSSALAREFVYTADDERIATYTIGSSWRWTIRETSGKVLREFSSQDGLAGLGSSAWKWGKDHVWRDGLLLASRQPDDDKTTTYHYHLDHLGTPRRVTDQDDRIIGVHDYFAFGPETAGGTAERSVTALKYTGHERDLVVGNESADTLDYMHARYYSSYSGRFLSVDPIPGDVHKPQSWNMYAYVQNNPLRGIDPKGLNLHVMTPEAARDLCGMVGPDCNKYVLIGKAGNVTINATAADLQANEALNLINDLVTSTKNYGAWEGTSIPSGSTTITLGPHAKNENTVNISATLRTDILAQLNLPLPPGFDGAVGIFSGSPSIAKGADGKPVSMPALLFHKLAEKLPTH